MPRDISALVRVVSFLCFSLSSVAAFGPPSISIPKSSISPNLNSFTQSSRKSSSSVSFLKSQSIHDGNVFLRRMKAKTSYKARKLFVKGQEDEEVDTDIEITDRPLTFLEQIVASAGIVAGPLTLYSEYILKTTGCGLPAGPFGLIGAAEGVSYLVIVYIVGWSLYTKVTTGKGLPAGNGGLLGAAEGIAYLSLLTGLIVFGFQIKDYGFIPEPVPVEGGRCS